MYLKKKVIVLFLLKQVTDMTKRQPGIVANSAKEQKWASFMKKKKTTGVIKSIN